MTAGTVRIPAAVWGQAAVVVLGAFGVMLSATIVAGGLPAIARDLGSSAAMTQWVSTGYLLALTAAVPVSGWAARRVGATRLWLCCTALFCASSIWWALSGSIALLLVGRIVQGFCGGLLVPAGQMILAVVAGPQRMGRVLSTIGVPVVLAPTLGTTVGSVLVDRLGWPWLFWVGVPLGAVALGAGLHRLPRLATTPPGPFDWWGYLLIGTGLPLLIYGIAAVGTAGGLGSRTADLCTAGGAALMVAFVARSLRHRAPLLRIRLFRGPTFSAGATAMFFGGLVNFGAQIVLPLYFVQARHESALAAGLLILPQVIGTAIAFPLAGRLADRHGGGAPVLAGAALAAVATIPLALAGTGTGYGWLGTVLLIRGFGVALATIPAMTAVLTSVAPAQLPDATSILNVLQRTGASFGTAVLAVLYTTHLDGTGNAAAAAHAFDVVGWWLVGAAGLLVLPAWALARAEHHAPADCRSRHPSRQ